jgi:hypothetical protein
MEKAISATKNAPIKNKKIVCLGVLSNSGVD